MTSSEKSVRIPVELQESSIPVPQTQFQKLTGEMLSNQTDGFYHYIEDISPIKLFIYLIIILSSILLMAKFPISSNHIVGIALGIVIVYYLNERDRVINVDDLKKIEIQMESIVPKPKYFYIDANIIELIYNLLEFYDYNPTDFETMVQSIDNLLKLRLDIERGMVECEMIYDVAVDQKNKALNSIAAILISLPAQQILKEKLIAGIKILQLYLLRHLDFIKQTCENQTHNNGININTKLITDLPIKSSNDEFNIF